MHHQNITHYWQFFDIDLLCCGGGSCIAYQNAVALKLIHTQAIAFNYSGSLPLFQSFIKIAHCFDVKGCFIKFFVTLLHHDAFPGKWYGAKNPELLMFIIHHVIILGIQMKKCSSSTNQAFFSIETSEETNKFLELSAVLGRRWVATVSRPWKVIHQIQFS